MTGRDKDRVVQEAEHYRRKGYAAGLDDAREAIRNAKRIRCADDALAAIDALSGERSGNLDTPPSAENPDKDK